MIHRGMSLKASNKALPLYSQNAAGNQKVQEEV